MRSLKFRAYQKTPSLNHKPSLYEVTGLDFYEGDYGGGEVCLRNKKGEQWTEYIKDVVLEQYTGLKDKNGKEIYEGDIVEVWIGGCKQNEPYVIKDMRELYNEFHHDDGYYQFDEVKVIGNIHENPELLEVK